jgi:hypothetical protein
MVATTSFSGGEAGMQVEVLDLGHEQDRKPMSFSEFTLADLKRHFGLCVEEAPDVFAAVTPVPVSSNLTETLRENLPLALAISTEKARSEMIIAPVLIEVRRQCQRKISLFSGTDFFVGDLRLPSLPVPGATRNRSARGDRRRGEE